MYQVLFYIPLNSINESLPNIPIHGYGFMLFVAFVIGTLLATYLAKQQNIPPVIVQDLAIFIFMFGISGARITYMIQYGVPWYKFYEVWEGGLVFYGSAIGGVVGFLVGNYFILRKHNVSPWKMLDVIAPVLALGMAIGRFGCLLNGCCYGGVACESCPSVGFPLPTDPRVVLVGKGHQTAAGFAMAAEVGKDERMVGLVTPGSLAEINGVRSGDIIIKINDQKIADYADLQNTMGAKWPRGENWIQITVDRHGETITLPAYAPYTIGLHPSQIYESISTFLIFLLLMSYWPFRRHDGEVMVIVMICYSIHRFLNEILRDDTAPVAFDMTLSQNISIIVFASAIFMGFWLQTRPARGDEPQVDPNASAPTQPNEKEDDPLPESSLQD